MIITKQKWLFENISAKKTEFGIWLTVKSTNNSTNQVSWIEE